MGDTTRRATLIISAKNDASAQIGDNALKFTELNSAIELGKKAIEAFKQVYDFAKEGASIERIGEQWKATADQFGVSSEVAVKAIQRITNGTVDDEEIMKIATRELTQNVVANGQQLTDFFGIARAMTVRFGGDVVANSQAIDLAIETGMARQLKAKGIVVDFAQAYKDYADKLGVAATSLSEETKLEIRRNEVLTQGDVLVKKVGDTGSDAATKFEQLDTSLKDLGDSLKTIAADGLSPFMVNQQRLKDMMDVSLTPTERLKAAVDSYNTATSDAERNIAGQMLPVLENMIVQQGIAAKTTDLLDQSTRHMGQSFQDAIPPLEQLGNKTVPVTGHLKELAVSAKDISDAWKTNIDLSIKLTTENKNSAIKQDDLTQKATDLETQIKKLSLANGAVVTSHKAVSLSTDEVSAANSKLLVIEEDLTQHQRKKNETDLEFKARMDGLVVSADNLRSSLDGVTKVGTVDNSKEIKKLQDDLTGVNKDIMANRVAHDDATKHIVFDYAMQQMAVGGFTDTEQKALNLLAAQFGFTSDSADGMALGIIAATSKLANDGNIGAFDTAILKMTGRTNANLDSLKDNVDQLHAKLSALAATDFNVRVNVERYGSGVEGGLMGTGGQPPPPPKPRTPHVNPGAAGGADFIVPPGYLNDSYNLRVQSGEHVRVTPAGGNSGQSINIGPVIMNGVNDPQAFVRQLNALLGNQARLAMAGGAGIMGS